MTAFAHAKANGLSAVSRPEWDLLTAPKPPLRAMSKLRCSGFVTAASDNSDGLLGAIWNIAAASKCAVEIDMSDHLVPFSIREAAMSLGVSPWNLMFCWGDWQVICAVRAESVEVLNRLAASENVRIQALGRAVAGPPSVYGCRSGRCAPLNVIRNESFTSASFNRGIETQLEFMLKSPLFRTEGHSRQS
jgi:thiamine-monophosphate kinase